MPFFGDFISITFLHMHVYACFLGFSFGYKYFLVFSFLVTLLHICMYFGVFISYDIFAYSFFWISVNGRSLSCAEVHQAVAPKSEIIEVNSGKKVGTVTTALGSRGLALLRLEAAFKNTSQLNVKGLENVNVKVIRPKWWPSEWGQEEEQATAVA